MYLGKLQWEAIRVENGRASLDHGQLSMASIVVARRNVHGWSLGDTRTRFLRIFVECHTRGHQKAPRTSCDTICV
jgi:hypothetical protein